MDAISQRTSVIYLWSRVFNTPFWAIFSMLAMILYKELHATALQTTFLIALKPIAALFSPYWSARVQNSQDSLKANLALAGILKYIPFLLFPWIHNVPFCIGAFFLYMIFLRGTTPAWMETMRLNLAKRSQERIFSIGSVIDYLGTALLPIALGTLLDGVPGSWQWIFFSTALLGLSSTLLFLFLPLPPVKCTTAPPSFKQALLTPWKESYSLLKKRGDFRRFQVGFMLGGSALMMIHSVLPIFFLDVLDLSYTKIMIAMAFCKGIGFTLSSPFWVKFFRKIDIYRFSGMVTLSAALFCTVLTSGYFHISGVYLAYLIYGTMQAGSELSWHLSGPHFAQNEDSIAFSSTNVVTVGIRGCIAPFLGSVICTLTNSTCVMCAAALLCLLATYLMNAYGKREELRALRS